MICCFQTMEISQPQHIGLVENTVKLKTTLINIDAKAKGIHNSIFIIFSYIKTDD